MFAQTFVEARGATRKPWTLAASLTVQTAIVGALVIVPLLHPDILQLKIQRPVWLPIPLMITPVPPELKVTTSTRSTQPRVFTAPATVPIHIAKIVEAPVDAPDPGIYVQGAPLLGIKGIPGDALPIKLPDTPPAAPKPAAVQPKAPEGPLRISSTIQAARLLFGPKPPYPTLAKAARVQGVVKLQAIIAPDGAISRLEVMSGPALLINAARDAVSQWRYRPTLLNNAPVEVATEIDVIFTLSQ